MPDNKLLDTYLESFDDMKKHRQPFESLVQDACEFCLPNRNINRKMTPGTMDHEELLDDTGAQSAYRLAAFIHGALASLTTAWFHIRAFGAKKTKQSDLETRSREWIQNTEKSINIELENSSFYLTFMEWLLEYVVPGTATLYVDQSVDWRRRKQICTFRAIPWEQMHIREDYNGLVNTGYRCYEEPGRNLLAQFDSLLNSETRKELEKNPSEPKKVLHCVEPVKDGDKMKNSLHRWKSVYILADEGNKSFLNYDGAYKGFKSFPYFVSRFKKMPGETYGRSPAMDALPSMRTLNKAIELQLKGAELAMLPPWFFQAGTFNDAEINLIPGLGIQVRDPDKIREYQGRPRQDIAQLIIEEFRRAIKSHFFVDLTQMPNLAEQGTPPSATQINQTVTFMSRLSEPIFSRMLYEAVEPMMIRVIELMLDGDPPRLEDAPQELKEKGMEIDFVGQLAMSQRYHESLALDEMLEFAGTFRQTVPELDDVFDFTEAIRERSVIRGVPEHVLYTPKETKKRQDARLQAQAQAQMAQQINMDADSASKGATALRAISGGGGA